MNDVTTGRLAGRALWLMWVVATGLAGLGLRLARRPRTAVVGPVAARTIERLGPTYVKFGQVLSTRTDLVPAPAVEALGRLFDQVRPVPPAVSAALLPPALLAAIDGGAAGLRPVAAGSIASVYHARLRGGDEVAVKVRRPGIARAMAVDVALLRAGARFMGRLPGLRGAPLAEIVTEVGDSVLAQLDLVQEARALHRLGVNLAAMADVRVPGVRPQWSTAEVLVLEFLPGLDRAARPALPPDTARRAMVHAVRAVYQMLFVDGLVHCDLHPGNLHLLADGTVSIVDGGFTRALTEDARRAFAQFFFALHTGDGERCAEIVLSTARRAATADVPGFRTALVDLVVANHGRPVAEFDLVSFAVRLFAAQRANGLYADPQFVFPLLSLIVLEGTARRWCPEIGRAHV